MGVEKFVVMGVQKETIRKGDGVNFPQKGQRVKVHYKGTLADGSGKQFDSTYDDKSKDKPFSFVVGKGQVIPGWEIGISQLSLGERAKLLISSDLCYGSEGCTDDCTSCTIIPPNTDLEFEVELLDIKSYIYSAQSLRGSTATTTTTTSPRAIKADPPTKEQEEEEKKDNSSGGGGGGGIFSFFKPVERPPPLKPDSTLDEDLQNSADDANLTLYFVNMVVVSATDLANTDSALLLDKSDPYCEIQIGEITDKTDTIDNNLNPVWNEKMSFFVPKKPEKMFIRVKDSNTHLQDDDVGSAEFDFGSFFEIGGFFEGDLPLVMPNGKEQGSIKINLKCRTLKPVETEIKLGYATKQLECLGLQQDATLAALDESEELRKQVVGELGHKEQEVLQKAAELEQAVTLHNKELSAKDQELLDRAQEIEDKIQEKEEAEVARREAELKEKAAETKLTEAEKEIIAQAEMLEIKERTNKEALTEKEKEILAVAEQLEAKEQAHDNIQKRLFQVEALKQEVENELTSKDKIIQEQAKQLEKAMASGEALSKKEQELVETAKALQQRDEAAKQAQKMQDAANTELEKLRQQNRELEARAAEAEKTCGCIVM